MWANTSPDRMCAARSLQVAIAPGGLDAVERARRLGLAVPADAEAVAVRRLRTHRRVEALVDERVLRLVQQLLDEHGRPRICEPAAHQCAKALPLASSCTGAGWLEPGELALDVGDEHVRQVVREAASNDDAQRREIGAVLGEGVRRYLPAALAQGVRHVEHRVVLDAVFQREREDGKLVAPREQLERADLGDPRTRAASRRRAHTPGRVAIAGEPEADEVVVLRDDLRAGSREVEREGRHVVAEVVHPEDQVLRERVGVAPDDPADTGIHEPVLVAGRVDRRDPRQAEVPLEVGVEERRDHRSGRAVHVHRDVDPGLALVGVERVADVLDRLVRPVEGRAENRDDADRVLVAALRSPRRRTS